MPTKWYWVIHGRLTSERKAYTSHRHSSITRPLPAAPALKHQAPCLMHEHSTGSERVDALGLPAVEVIICMITRDFSVISNDVTGVSLSLSLSLSQKSLTHNIGSASALPIIRFCVFRPFIKTAKEEFHKIKRTLLWFSQLKVSRPRPIFRQIHKTSDTRPWINRDGRGWGSADWGERV